MFPTRRRSTSMLLIGTIATFRSPMALRTISSPISRHHHQDLLVRAERRRQKFFNDFSRACARRACGERISLWAGVRLHTGTPEFEGPAIGKSYSTPMGCESPTRPAIAPIGHTWTGL